MEYLGNLKNTVVNAINVATNNTPSPIVSRADVLSLEEGERSRRVAQVSQASTDKENAVSVSRLIKDQSFPVFRGNVSKGYKRVTTRFEEDERRRRLTNKSESSLRRNNANKTSRMLQELGWPFYQQHHTGAEYFVMDPTKLLEEEERQWRTSDSYWGPTAKHNAAMVANILRWGNFQRNPLAGFRRHAKFLEEKERRDRLNNMEAAMLNAYKEAGLIKKMGPPFYVQESQPVKRDFSNLNQLEELERKRRMEHPEEQQLARELAGVISGKPLINDLELEEQERGRRITDKKQQKIAKENAKTVSLLVRESSMNKISGAGPMWFSVSRNSMRALEEIERTRRLRDIDGQRSAKQHAKLVSDMVTRRLAAPAKRRFSAIEEDERQSRMVDRSLQQLAMKNARKVSGLVARHHLMSSGSRTFALALEESERARRLEDANQQSLAKDNARKVSSLVSSLNVAPSTKSVESPATVALPTYSAPATASPVTINITNTPSIPSTPISTPLQQSPLRSSTEFRPTSPLVAAAPAAVRFAPAEPQVSANPLPATVASIPVASIPAAAIPAAVQPQVSAAPVAAPITSVGSLFSAAPVAPLTSGVSSTTPISLPVTKSVPIVAPSTMPAAPTQMVMPNTAAPVPVMPLASATAPLHTRATTAAPIAHVDVLQAQPYTHVPVVPVDTAAISHPVLGERERKRLMKQAQKHNRKSEKEVRKAEQQMLKAERMHQKGRDDKAIKLESKAEMMMKNAEHEKRWANGLQGEISHNAPAPASM